MTAHRRVYLDHAATTPPPLEVVAAVREALEESWGNPSSIHGYGQAARRVVERAREAVARLLGAAPAEIVFTGSGTEADNMAILGVARAARAAGRGDHVITSAVEHHAVLHACHRLEEEGFAVTHLPVDRFGVVGPDAVRAALRPGTVLVTIIYASNEVGSIQPIEEIGWIAREAGVIFHSDAVQAAGALPLDVSRLPVDLLTLSAHKLGGPKGVGALYVRAGTRVDRLLVGGGQERGRRAGTENVPGIAGFGKAAELAAVGLAERAGRMRAARDRLLAGIRERIPEAVLNGHPERRLPNNANVSFPGADSETLLVALDLHGVAASGGSACAAGSVEPSHVLRAMGLPPGVLASAVRFSTGPETAEAEVDYVLEVLPAVVARARGRGRAAAGGGDGPRRG